jgi:hypothetical protein
MLPCDVRESCLQWGVEAVGLVGTSNGNASETKANESFNNGVFIEAKRTPLIVSKLFSKRNEHIIKNFFVAKRTRSIAKQLFSKRKQTCPIVRKLFRSEANTLDRKNIIFETK